MNNPQPPQQNDPQPPQQQYQPQQYAQEPPQQQYQQPYQQPSPVKKSGLAIVALVVGIAAFLLGWVPILGIIMGLSGIGLGIWALIVKQSKVMSIIGIALASIALITSGITTAGLAGLVNEAANTPVIVPKEPIPKPETEPEVPEPYSGESSFEDGILITRDVRIEITDHKIIPVGETGNEYGSKPVIAFWYEVTNLTDDRNDISPMNWLFVFEAYQDNNPNAENTLQVATLPDDSFLRTQMENIKPGGTVQNAVAYELDDETTPVDLVAYDSLRTDEIDRMTFNVE